MFDYIDIAPPAVEVVVANDASRWGVGKRTGDEAYVSGTAQFNVGSAFYAGAEVNNADYGVGADNEIVLFGGVNGEVAGFDVTVGGEYRKLNGTLVSDPEAVEFFVSGAREFGPVSTKVTLGYSPDDFFNEKSTYWTEAAVAYDFGKTTVGGAVGYKFGGFSDSEYTAWNVGVTQDLTDKVSVDVRYYDTDAPVAWGEVFEDRTVATLRVKF